MKTSLAILLLMVFTLSSGDETTVDPTDSPHTTYSLVKDEATTLGGKPSTNAKARPSGMAVVDPEARRIRRERRKEMRKVSANYETFYYQLSSETYTKMMSMTEDCAKELELDADPVKECTTKKLSRRKNKKGGNNKKAGKQTAENATPTVVVDDQPTPSVDDNKPKSWRDITRFEESSVQCYVDQMRKNDPWKKMPQNEWRNERDKMVLDYFSKKMNCLKQKLNL